MFRSLLCSIQRKYNYYTLRFKESHEYTLVSYFLQLMLLKHFENVTWWDCIAVVASLVLSASNLTDLFI